MKKQILISLLITLFTVLPNIVVAQEPRIYAQMEVALYEIQDRGAIPLDNSLKDVIASTFKSALTKSQDFKVFSKNIDEIKRNLAAKGKSPDSPANILKEMKNQGVDYVVYIETIATGDRMGGSKITISGSLYRMQTNAYEDHDVKFASPDHQSIKNAVEQLISKLLGVKTSAPYQSGNQSSGYNSNSYNNSYTPNNYSNNQSYGYGQQQPSYQQPQGNYGYSNGYGQQQTRGTINGHEYVDLGLSVKWATCNVGAYMPENPGKHYAWGETTTKSSYTSSNSETYGVSMGDISGNSRYDVARAIWGGTWRLPTSEEFEELIQCCTWTWTTENGQKGYKVTSRRNGNSIFFPAAGYRYDSSLYNAGSYGYIWSSSPYDSNNAYDLGFDSSVYEVGWGNRLYGISVRAVSE